MRIDSKDVLYRSLAILYRYAKDLAVLEYPRSMDRRSIDLVVSLKDGRKALIKVTADAADIPKSEIAELSNLSASMGAAPLIVAKTRHGEELLPGVAYDKSGVNLVSPDTIEGVLSGKDPVYIYESRESFRVKIDPARMREKRINSGLSLGDLALYMKTSRKAVYEYEKGKMDPSIEKAQILIKILGDDIVREYDIFESSKKPQFTRKKSYDSEIEAKIAEVLAREGYMVVHAKKTVMDLGGSKDEEKIVIVVRHPRESSKSLLEKCAYLSRMASIIGVEKKLAIVDSPSIAKDLEHEGVDVITPGDIEELLNYLQSRKGEESE